MTTIHQIGQTSFNGGGASSVSIITTEAISAGETCVIAFSVFPTIGSVSSITDAGSTWAKADGNDLNGSSHIWYSAQHAALGAGSTITLNFVSSTQRGVATLYRIVGLNCVLKDHGATNGASGSPSVSTAGSVDAGDVVFGTTVVGGGVPITPPGGIWVSDYNSILSSNSFNQCHGITASPGVAKFNPTAAGAGWDAAIAAFKQTNVSGLFIFF